MQVIPAIDLKGRQCVRLYKGDFTKKTVYEQDPLAMLEQFEKEGATWVHIVDLDGAQDPTKSQFEFVRDLCGKSNINIQLGGGIRTQTQIEELFAMGVRRAVIGSLAVTNPELVMSWISQFGSNSIVLAADLKFINNDYYVATHGWQTESKITASKLLQMYASQVDQLHVLCTDIDRDGTLLGPNVELYRKLLKEFPRIKLQASGGIKCLQDLENLRSNNLSACIVGKALYEGKFKLTDVVPC
jgi:phosphoribosylformimino-5-aminoimidazole carboxamide ribotide isomerase